MEQKKITCVVQKKEQNNILWAHMRNWKKYITPSPDMNDTLLIKNPDNQCDKKSIQKLPRGCSMHKLHNDLIPKTSSGFPEAYYKNRILIISTTQLRVLLSLNVKKLTTKYKEKHGIKIYTLVKGN